MYLLFFVHSTVCKTVAPLNPKSALSPVRSHCSAFRNKREAHSLVPIPLSRAGVKLASLNESPSLSWQTGRGVVELWRLNGLLMGIIRETLLSSLISIAAIASCKVKDLSKLLTITFSFDYTKYHQYHQLFLVTEQLRNQQKQAISLHDSCLTAFCQVIATGRKLTITLPFLFCFWV